MSAYNTVPAVSHFLGDDFTPDAVLEHVEVESANVILGHTVQNRVSMLWRLMLMLKRKPAGEGGRGWKSGLLRDLKFVKMG